MNEQDFNISLRVHNARLLGRVRRQYRNAAEMARRFGLNPIHLREYMSFKRAPIAPNGSVRPDAFEICRALGCEFEDIWPEHLAEATMKTNVAEIEVSRDEVQQVIAGPEKTTEYRQLIGTLFECLSPRERLVVEMSADGATLDGIGAEIGVTRERVLQILIKSQRNMQAKAARLGIENLTEAL